MSLNIYKILEDYNLTDDGIENIYKTLKSLFRIFKLKGLCAPEILFEMEDQILKNNMSNLKSTEIYIVVNVWSEFKEEMVVQDELDNISLDSQINKEMKKMD